MDVQQVHTTGRVEKEGQDDGGARSLKTLFKAKETMLVF